LRDQLESENDVHNDLSLLLSKTEFINFRERIDRILRSPVFPSPGAGRPYPWPLV
jgi:hypothetical protein